MAGNESSLGNFDDVLRGLSEDERKQLMKTAGLTSTSGRETYACAVCGKSSGAAIVQIENEAGDILYTSPTQWVYCYRQGKSFGICNLCFEAKRLSKFTPDEIAWLQEEFSKVDAEEDSNWR